MANPVQMGGGMTEGGYFQFPQLSQSDIIKQRVTEQQDLFNKLVSEQAANLPAQDRGIFQSFAQLGRALGGKPVAQLTADEKQKLGIMQKSNDYMKEQMATPEWQDLDPREKALRSQDAIARAAYDMGAVDIGSSVSLNTAKTRLAFKKADTEQTKLEGDVAAQDQEKTAKGLEIDFNTMRNQIAKEGKPDTYVVPDSDGKYNWENPTLKTGKVGLDGQLVADDGTKTGDWLAMDHYTALQTNAAKIAKANGSAGGDFIKTLKGAVTPTAMEKAKASRADAIASTKLLGVVTDVVDSAVKRGEDPRAVVGAAGTFNSTIGKIVDAASGVMDGFSTNLKGVEVLGPNGQPVGYKKFDDLAQEYTKKIKLPAGMDMNSSDAVKYRSAVMQALYLDARLEEPGARQLSDADIARAAERLGIESNDPATIFATLSGKFKRNIDTLHTSAQQYRTTAASLGLDPARAERVIYGGTMDELDAEYQKQAARFAKLLPDVQSAEGKDSVPSSFSAPAPASVNSAGAPVYHVDENGDLIQN